MLSKLNKFYDDEYPFILKNQKKYIFETNQNQILEFREDFINKLKKIKIKQKKLIRYEHLSCVDRNEVITNSHKGYRIFNIVINYLKLENKLNLESNCKLKLEKIIIANQNKYLSEKYNYFLIYSFFWSLYEKYGFKKISELILSIVLNNQRNDDTNYLDDIIEDEFKDIFMIRDKLKLNEYPKLLIKLNLENNNILNDDKLFLNFNKISNLIKNILCHSLKINEEFFGINDNISFWIKNEYEWILFYCDEFKKDPLSFFQKINKEAKNCNFNESGNYYKKKKCLNSIFQIYKKIHGKLETITNYMDNTNKKQKMKKLIDELNINDKHKKILKEWWKVRGQTFAHTKELEKELFLWEFDKLDDLKNKMKKYEKTFKELENIV